MPQPEESDFDLEEKHCLESAGVVQDLKSVDRLLYHYR
jgi:hypothetical protein